MERITLKPKEAEKLQCPFSTPIEYEKSGYKKIEIVYCSTSLCMAWRWASKDDGYCKLIDKD